MEKKTIYWIVGGIILFLYYRKCSEKGWEGGRARGCQNVGGLFPNVCKPLTPLLKCSADGGKEKVELGGVK